MTTSAPLQTIIPTRPGLSDESAGMLLGLIGVAIFSLTLPFTRMAVGSFEPAFVAFGRGLVAALLAAGWLRWKRAPLPPRAALAPLAMVSAGCIVGFPWHVDRHAQCTGRPRRCTGRRAAAGDCRLRRPARRRKAVGRVLDHGRTGNCTGGRFRSARQRRQFPPRRRRAAVRRAAGGARLRGRRTAGAKPGRRAGDLLGADFIAAGAAAGDGLAVVARRAAHRPCRRARLDGIRLRFRVLDVHRLLLLVSRHGAGRRGAGRTGTTGAAVFKLAGRRRAAQGSAVMVECAVRAGRHRGGGGGPADARQALGIQRGRAVATLTPRLIYNVPSTSPRSTRAARTNRQRCRCRLWSFRRQCRPRNRELWPLPPHPEKRRTFLFSRWPGCRRALRWRAANHFCRRRDAWS